ncbi:hypothetical protein ACFU7Y_10500 [Kitasatospora sp. NPDC057542]|uniref:hypothetical protein n=1 Tax=Kitasatospora sp. NPDC057542 TaxID=3346162 RepID=UPI00367A8D1E
MTFEQVAEAKEEAAMLERHRFRACYIREDMAATENAIERHKEWRRIGYVMAKENLTTYDPDRDPTVQRRHREEHARLAAVHTQTTEPTTHHPIDPRLQTILTALGRAGLYNLTEADHQAAAVLAQLDHTTVTQLTTRLERTRETALHLAASTPPTGPPYRRPRPAARAARRTRCAAPGRRPGLLSGAVGPPRTVPGRAAVVTERRSLRVIAEISQVQGWVMRDGL